MTADDMPMKDSENDPIDADDTVLARRMHHRDPATEHPEEPERPEQFEQPEELEETVLSQRMLEDNTVLSSRSAATQEDPDATIVGTRQSSEETVLDSRKRRSARRLAQPSEVSPVPEVASFPATTSSALPREETRVSSSTVRVAYDPGTDGIAVKEYDPRSEGKEQDAVRPVLSLQETGPLLPWGSLPHRGYKSQKLLGAALIVGGIACAAGLIAAIVYLASGL